MRWFKRLSEKNLQTTLSLQLHIGMIVHMQEHIWLYFCRINTIMDYDRILVMENGYVVEFDAPQQLLQNTNGHFYKMVHSNWRNLLLYYWINQCNDWEHWSLVLLSGPRGASEIHTNQIVCCWPVLTHMRNREHSYSQHTKSHSYQSGEQEWMLMPPMSPIIEDEEAQQRPLGPTTESLF